MLVVRFSVLLFLFSYERVSGCSGFVFERCSCFSVRVSGFVVRAFFCQVFRAFFRLFRFFFPNVLQSVPNAFAGVYCVPRVLQAFSEAVRANSAISVSPPR